MLGWLLKKKLGGKRQEFIRNHHVPSVSPFKLQVWSILLKTMAIPGCPIFRPESNLLGWSNWQERLVYFLVGNGSNCHFEGNINMLFNVVHVCRCPCKGIHWQSGWWLSQCEFWMRIGIRFEVHQHEKNMIPLPSILKWRRGVVINHPWLGGKTCDPKNVQ